METSLASESLDLLTGDSSQFFWRSIPGEEDAVDVLGRNSPEQEGDLVAALFMLDLGGVEMHIYNLSQCLIDKGHHVIVITGTYS